jgi:hypothetical protein
MGIKHSKVSTVADSATTVDVSPTEWNADHSINGPVILSSGTATNTPLLFSSGALNTVATAGAVEYDGTCFYNTAIDATRQVNCSMQVMVQTTSRTLTTSTAAQKLLNETTNGAVTVGPGTYFWESAFALTGLSTTVGHGHNFGIAGTATIVRSFIYGGGKISQTLEAPVQPGIIFAFATVAQITFSTTTPTIAGIVNGKLVVGASGTIIPTISVSSGNATAATLTDAFFRIWPIGSSVTGFVGNWS